MATTASTPASSADERAWVNAAGAALAIAAFVIVGALGLAITRRYMVEDEQHWLYVVRATVPQLFLARALVCVVLVVAGVLLFHVARRATGSRVAACAAPALALSAADVVRRAGDARPEALVPVLALAALWLALTQRRAIAVIGAVVAIACGALLHQSPHIPADDLVTRVFVWHLPLFSLALVGAAQQLHARKPALVVFAALGLAYLLAGAQAPPYGVAVLCFTCAPLAAAGGLVVVRALDRSSRTWAALSAAALVLVGPVYSWKHLNFATVDSLWSQQALLQFIDALVPPDAAVWSFSGISPQRASLPHWGGDAKADYDAGRVDLGAELATTRPLVVIESARVPGWLRRDDARLLAEHYVEAAPSVLVPGRLVLEARRVWQPWHSGAYDVRVEEDATCTIDGAPVTRGARLDVDATRTYVIEARGGACTVIWHLPAGATSTISGSSRTRYVMPPLPLHPSFR